MDFSGAGGLLRGRINPHILVGTSVQRTTREAVGHTTVLMDAVPRTADLSTDVNTLSFLSNLLTRVLRRAQHETKNQNAHFAFPLPDWFVTSQSTVQIRGGLMPRDQSASSQLAMGTMCATGRVSRHFDRRGESRSGRVQPDGRTGQPRHRTAPRVHVCNRPPTRKVKQRSQHGGADNQISTVRGPIRRISRPGSPYFTAGLRRRLAVRVRGIRRRHWALIRSRVTLSTVILHR